MKQMIQSRLDELHQELEKGQQSLAALEQQRTLLKSQLLRIGGAIQVLEDLLAGADQKRPRAVGE